MSLRELKKTNAELYKVITGPYEEVKALAPEEWFKQSYHQPSESAVRLGVANRLLEGYGVEYLRPARSDSPFRPEGVSYVNMGEMYVTTVIFDHKRGEYLCMDLGTFLEKNHRRFSA